MAMLLKCYFCFFQLIQYMIYIAEHFVVMQEIPSKHYKIEKSLSKLNSL